MNTDAPPFGGRAYVILTGVDSVPPSLEEVQQSGKISALFEIEAGGRAAFEADPWVKAYLDNNVPVIAVFDDEADAVALHAKIQRGRN